MEIKPIKNFEGVYAAREDGEIISLKHNKIAVRKGGISSGYRSYSLRKDGVQTQHLGHRLIAEAFIDNPENKPQVNHIDGDKTNNAASNLEWVTVSENAKHAVANGLTVIADSHLKRMQTNAGKAKAKFTKTDALNIRAIYSHMAKPSCRKLAKAYNCSKTTIQRIVNGSQTIFKELPCQK